jgi:diguanylate cyclase (GGDEF)-like protein
VVGAQSVEAGVPAFEHSPNREDCRFLVNSIVDYVRRTGEAVAVDDACQPQHHLPGLHNEPHIVQNQVRSIVCVPVVSGMKADTLAGVLYLENQSVTGAFNRRHLSLLEIIASTIAARLDMHKLATTDRLTQLANRAHFDQVFKDKVEIARLRHQDLSLIMIDIDRFKSFNDDHGHQAGDAVLQHVASVLRSCCRARDLCARYGGEELCVIVPNASKADAAQLAQRIRKSIESSKLAWQDKVLSVTASLGVASLGEQCPDETLLLQAADQAMYRAKQGGRNQVQLA